MRYEKRQRCGDGEGDISAVADFKSQMEQPQLFGRCPVNESLCYCSSLHALLAHKIEIIVGRAKDYLYHFGGGR
jgi:hypothetical protein